MLERSDFQNRPGRFCVCVCFSDKYFTLMSRGLLADMCPEETAANNSVVSADDFQFPSAKYEIIVLPISAAKLWRQSEINTAG